MEEYSAWVVLKDKWPLALVLFAVILTIFIVTEVSRRAEKKKKKPAPEECQR